METENGKIYCVTLTFFGSRVTESDKIPNDHFISLSIKHVQGFSQCVSDERRDGSGKRSRYVNARYPNQIIIGIGCEALSTSPLRRF